MVSVGLDLTRPGLSADFIEKHPRKHALLLIPGRLSSVDQVPTRQFHDLLPIRNRDVLLVKPTQNRLATLRRGVFKLECNRLVVSVCNASDAAAGFTRKLPRTCWNLASPCQILWRSPQCSQQARQQRSGAVQLPGEIPQAHAGLM